MRDLLLGRPSTDFDLVVEGDAIAFARGLSGRYGGHVTAHTRFGTAQWFMPTPGHLALDFVSTRSESYKHPGALPAVTPGTLQDDLGRRDFTINTLAMRLDGEHWGELHDELGGLQDLRQGLLRVLHPASFMDDPTRLFRMVRYEQRYGLHVAPETLSLVAPALPLVNLLSADRVRHELDLILEEDLAAAMLDRLANLELLSSIHPAVPWDRSTRARFLRATDRLPESPIKFLPSNSDKAFLAWHFWLMVLSEEDLLALENRLHFHAKLLHSLQAAAVLYRDLSSLAGMQKPSQVVARLDDLPVTAAYAVYLAVPAGQARRNLQNYLEIWRGLKPVTTGHTLMKRGLQPGPRFQHILTRLRQAWLDGEVHSELEETKLLEKLTNI